MIFFRASTSRRDGSKLRQLGPAFERLEDRLVPTTAPNGYLLAFTAALKVDLNGIRLGGIFVMRPDGSGLRQLTSFQTLDFNYELHGLNLPDDQPSFSPDGTKIVFTSNRDNGPRIGLSDQGFEIYVMDVNGTNIQRLTNSPGLDTEPVFSPDGSKIAFTSARSGNLDIWVMNANGSNPQRLTTSAQEDIEPAWSPDGTKIAFARVLGKDEKDVFMMNADGSNQHQLTFASGQDHDPSWSPDGTQLVITSERDGSPPFGDVFKINASTGAPVADLTSDLLFGGGDPAWSPDGKQIAFFKDDTPLKIPGTDLVVPPIRMWIMNADGSHKSVFQSQGLLNVHPAWGVAADSDKDGRLDYLENDNITFTQDSLGGGATAANDQFGTAIGTPDLSLDGKPDLAIGVPGAKVNGLAGAGRVDLAQGTPLGPDFSGIHGFGALPISSVDAKRLGGVAQAGGHFGQTIAVGNFRGIGNGFTETVIGAPGQNQVFVGEAPLGDWTILSGVGGFGSSLAVGDFNGDGRDDLAVGAPGASVAVPRGGTTVVQAGKVSIFFGGPNGLSTTPQQVIPGTLPALAVPGAGDQFGYSLASGDVAGDGASDLIVGVPGKAIGGVTSAGLVELIPGKVGLGLVESQAATRDGRSLPAPYTGLQAGARFGESVAAGHFHGGTLGSTDLVVGIPSQDIGGVPDAGLVAVYSGRGQLFTSGQPAAIATAFDALDVTTPSPGFQLSSGRFGQTLAVGDFTGDSVADLAIAAPDQAVGTFARAGLITIVPGSSPAPLPTGPGSINGPVGTLPTSVGLIPAAAQQFNLGQLSDFPTTNDRAGYNPVLPSGNTLAAGDLDGDGQAELLIGVPSRNNGGNHPMSGLVGIRYGVKVGTFTLTASHTTVVPGQEVVFTLEWIHPKRWHDLETVQLRLVGPRGVVAWVRFDEATGTFSLYQSGRRRFGPAATPGRRIVRRTAMASLDVSHSAVVGSGPEGRSVTLQIALRLGPKAAGHTYRVEVAATDHHGNGQGFELAGHLRVARARH